jgi:hypothetical protein
MRSSVFRCDQHGVEVRWIPPSEVSKLTGAHVRTVHNWMDRGWVHTRMLPSGRKVVCERSVNEVQGAESALPQVQRRGRKRFP